MKTQTKKYYRQKSVFLSCINICSYASICCYKILLLLVGLKIFKIVKSYGTNNNTMQEFPVVIVGAGPSGLAISACLTQNSISHIILEKEDCCASLWRKNAYDRLNLHLASEFCSLPFMPHPPSGPTYLSKDQFLQYIDKYVQHFNIKPRYCSVVVSAGYDEVSKKWSIETKNTREDTSEVYISNYLVIATGENSEGYIPNVPGLGYFEGEVVHSKYYKSGSKYESKKVLVVGCGNSGMEIAYDLYNWGANPSIVIRSPVRIYFFKSLCIQ
jgi:indole-3-pyruvate monooxygenase